MTGTNNPSLEQLATLAGHIDIYIREQDWDGLNSELCQIEVAKNDTLYLISWLRYTFLFRSKLPHWKTLRDNTKVYFEEQGLPPTLLKGL